MDWIHKAVIRPKIAYGAVVWAHSLTKGIDKSLNKVQRLAMLSITQPLRSTPTAGLEAILGWLPLGIHVQEMGMNTYLRNKDTLKPGWDCIGDTNKLMGHLGVWRALEEDSLNVAYPREKKISEHVWVDSPTEESLDKLELPLALYTDASKEGVNVGYSWVASIGDYVMDEGLISAKDICVYKAELLAVAEALEWLLAKGDKLRDNVIYSDSESVVNTLNGFLAKDELTKRVMMMLRELNRTNRTKVAWVKGHSGNVGNELADVLAKRGAKKARDLMGVEPFMPLLHKEIKSLVHDHFLSIWQERWESLKDCRISKLFYPKIRESRQVVKKSVKELQSLAQIVTGHGLYKNHMRHWVEEMDDDQCSLCGEASENTWHLWEWCPKLAKNRMTIRQLINNGLMLENGLLRFMNYKEITELRAQNEALLPAS